MRYINVITRVCRDGCISFNGSKCLLYDEELEKIYIDGNICYVVSEKCIYKRNKVKEDNTAPLFNEE